MFRAQKITENRENVCLISLGLLSTSLVASIARNIKTKNNYMPYKDPIIRKIKARERGR